MDEAARERRKEEIAKEVEQRMLKDGSPAVAWFNFLLDAILDIEERLATLERSVDFLKRQTGD